MHDTRSTKMVCKSDYGTYLISSCYFGTACFLYHRILTVLVTVHAYVFFSLYVVNGNTLMTINRTDSVIAAINSQGGVYMFGELFSERILRLKRK